MVGFYIIIVSLSAPTDLLHRSLIIILQALAAWYYPGDSSAHFMMYCKSIVELLASTPAQAALP
jgi:hypothetical protein